MNAGPARPSSTTSGPTPGPDHARGPSTRASGLIQELSTQVAQWLRSPLQRTIDEAAHRLFDLAEKARNGSEQQARMYSRDLLLRHRREIEEAFTDAVGLALEQLGEAPATTIDDMPPQPLGLVKQEQQDLDSACVRIAERGLARAGEALPELGYRLAVLVASPPLHGHAHPLGPYALTRAFHGAIAPIGLHDEHILSVLDSFGGTLVRQLAPVYQKANAHLLANGILAGLNIYANPGQPSRSPAPRHRRGPDTPEDVPTAAGQRADDDPIAVLDDLRELLKQQPRRGAVAPASGQAEAAQPAASDDQMQVALSALQRHFVNVTERASHELRSAQRLRKQLLGELNSGRATGSPRMRLSPEQDDTLELVTMLFEQLATQVQHGGTARALLGRMQLPVLRAAVADHDFFEQHEHPARKLLATVTEAADEWLDGTGGPADQGLASKLEQLIDRANRSPPSAGLYTSLLADIEHHLREMKTRAEATERRRIKAMQGRERLGDVQRRASQLMAERFSRSSPHGLVHVLLDFAWTDVLALNLLRHGESHPAFKAQLAITDQLLGLAPVTDRKQLQQDVRDGLCQIGMAAEEARQVAHRLTEPDKDRPSPGEDAPSTTELMVRLKKYQRFGKGADNSTQPVAPKPPAKAPAQPAPSANDQAETTGNRPKKPADTHRPATPATPAPSAADSNASRPSARAVRNPGPPPGANTGRQQYILQWLRRLPFDTWFEYIDEDSGQITQRKLAWYSTVSGHALMTARHGRLAEEIRMSELARQITLGHVRKMPARQGNLVDRAWRTLTHNLRRAKSRAAGAGIGEA